MASLVTGIVGGFQGRSAASNAEKAEVAAALKAAGIVDQATGEVNPQILESAMQAIAGMNTATSNAATGIETAAGTASAALNPYAEAGAEATRSLQDLVRNPQNFAPQDLEMDPGYQFRLQQAQRAIESSAAARGASLGGGALKALNRHIQGVASDEYSRAFDRFDRNRAVRINTLQGLVTPGLAAATTQGGLTVDAANLAGGLRVAGARYAGNTQQDAVHRTTSNILNNAGFRADMELEQGNARAAGHIGRANAWNGMLGAIGRTGDAFMAGGFSGGGRFNLRDAARYGAGGGSPYRR